MRYTPRFMRQETPKPGTGSEQIVVHVNVPDIQMPAVQLPARIEASKPQGPIAEGEVWLRIFCAALSCETVSGADAGKAADSALKRYKERFPVAAK